MASRDAGGRWADCRSAISRCAKPAGSHRTRACRAGSLGSPTATTRPPAEAGRARRGGVEPAAQGLLTGAQVGPGQHQPGVEQHDAGVAARGDRLGTRGGHHERRPFVDLGQRPGRPPRCARAPTGTPGRAPRRCGRSPSTGARRPRPPHSAHAQRGSAVPHHRQLGGSCGAVEPQRPRAGAAAGRGAAAVAGQAGDVALAGRLHQHRPGSSPARIASKATLGSRALRARGVALELRVGRSGDRDLRGALAQRRPVGADLAGPAGAEQVLRLDGAGEAADERRAGLLLGARRAAPRGRGGTARAARRRGRRRRPTARRARGRAPARRRRPGCRRRPARRRARPRGRPGSEPPGPSRRSGPRVARPRAPAVSAASRRATSRRSGTHSSDASARGQGGARPRGRAARPSRRRAGRTTPRAATPRPRARAGGGASVVRRPGAARPPRRRPSAGGAGGDSLLLDGGVPGRDGQPQHVGAGAGVAGGDRLGEPGDRRGQHRLGAHRPAQRREASGVVGASRPARPRSRRRPGRRSGP